MVRPPSSPSPSASHLLVDLVFKDLNYIHVGKKPDRFVKNHFNLV